MPQQSSQQTDTKIQKNRRHVAPAVRCEPRILSAAGCLLSRIENQLLDAPVEDFGNEQHVLGWARDFVNPAELLGLLAGFAEHAQHLAIEGELVDAARMGVGTVEHLVRRRRWNVPY